VSMVRSQLIRGGLYIDIYIYSIYELVSSIGKKKKRRKKVSPEMVRFKIMAFVQSTCLDTTMKYLSILPVWVKYGAGSQHFPRRTFLGEYCRASGPFGGASRQLPDRARACAQAYTHTHTHTHTVFSVLSIRAGLTVPARPSTETPCPRE